MLLTLINSVRKKKRIYDNRKYDNRHTDIFNSAYDQTAEVYKDVGSNAAGDSEDPEKICK